MSRVKREHVRVSGQSRLVNLGLAKRKGSSIQVGSWSMAQRRMQAKLCLVRPSFETRVLDPSPYSASLYESGSHWIFLHFQFSLCPMRDRSFTLQIHPLGVMMRTFFRLPHKDGAILTWSASTWARTKLPQYLLSSWRTGPWAFPNVALPKVISGQLTCHTFGG